MTARVSAHCPMLAKNTCHRSTRRNLEYTVRPEAKAALSSFRCVDPTCTIRSGQQPHAPMSPEALGTATSKPQGLREQPSRDSRGSRGSHREAPEALGAAISRLQSLSRPKWLQPQFSRVFSNILEPGDLLGSSPNGSGRLEEASGSFELAQEGFPVASSGFESAPKWPRGE